MDRRRYTSHYWCQVCGAKKGGKVTMKTCRSCTDRLAIPGMEARHIHPAITDGVFALRRMRAANNDLRKPSTDAKVAWLVPYLYYRANYLAWKASTPPLDTLAECDS